MNDQFSYVCISEEASPRTNQEFEDFASNQTNTGLSYILPDSLVKHKKQIGIVRIK